MQISWSFASHFLRLPKALMNQLLRSIAPRLSCLSTAMLLMLGCPGEESVPGPKETPAPKASAQVIPVVETKKATPPTEAVPAASALSHETISVEQSHLGQKARGQLVVRKGLGKEPKLAALAGAKAWLALAQAFAQAGNLKAMIHCTRIGIEQLGDESNAAAAPADGTQGVLAAEALIEKGQAKVGAPALLQALAERVARAEKAHPGVVAQVP
jgi:hypothetical protein